MKKFILTATVFLFPAVTLANTADLTYFDDLVVSLGNIIEQLIPILIGLGLLVFIWGLVQFILASGSEEAKAEGKRRMVWGIITLFVIVSVWGLVGLLADITGVETGGEVDIPTVPF